MAANLRFSGLYYSQVLRDLLAHSRRNTPEINDQDEHEPFTQLLSLLAFVFHQQSALLDHAAMESLLSTCRTRAGIENALALIGYKLKLDIPATTELVCKFSAVQSADKTLPARTRFETVATTDLPAISFETIDEAITLYRGDRLSWALSKQSSWIDFTDVANGDDPVAVNVFPSTVAAGHAVYFGHRTVMPTKLMLTFPTSLGSWDPNGTVVEYYDGQIDQTYPASCSIQSSILTRMDLTSLLGTYDRHGTEVWITSTRNGNRISISSVWNGTNNYYDLDVTDLGLSAASDSVSDFQIGAYWREVPDWTAINYSGSHSSKGSSWSLPETSTRRWTKADLSDLVSGAVSTGECYWLRWRAIASGGTGPTIQTASIAYESQYTKFDLVQGRTLTEQLGLSTETSNQAFTVGEPALIESSLKIEFDEGSGYEEWTAVDDFLTSASTDRHYVAFYDADGSAVVTVGDGTNGKLPVLDAPCRATYRVGARQDGNIAANILTSNTSGISFFSQVYNPRAAGGWKIAEGSTVADIDRLRVAGPASLRSLERVVVPNDASTVALNWVASDGSSPFVRAKVLEAYYGPKTAAILVVESGGEAPASILQEFEDYLNGDAATDTPGVSLFNTVLNVVRYTAELIDVSVTVKGGTSEEVESVLRAFFSATAQDENGEWRHDFGGTIYRTAVIAALFSINGVQNVPTLTLDGSASDYTLGTTSLPAIGTISVTIT